MNLFNLITVLENNDDLHLSRLLILLNSFAGKRGNGTIKGMTKLAKLDFLLRYPVYFENALKANNKNWGLVQVSEYERLSVESKMVRYKYGPWDHRYRRFINLLIAKDLAWVKVEGRTIVIGITKKGSEYSRQLVSQREYADIALRAKLLKSHFDIGATNLKEFIYKTFPELLGMGFGEEIHK
jgi:hypothetical protein